MSPPISSRVPLHMRYSREGYFEPKFVSIGPYYYDKLKEQQVMAKAKEECVLYFMNRLPACGSNWFRSLAGKIYTDEVQDQIDAWYSKSGINTRKKKFRKMLVRDSLFVIRIILAFSGEGDESMFFPGVDIKTVRFDLLLLENQIPFFFLRKVYRVLREDRVVPLARPLDHPPPVESPQDPDMIQSEFVAQGHTHTNPSSSRCLCIPLGSIPTLFTNGKPQQGQSKRHLLQSNPQQTESHSSKSPRSSPGQNWQLDHEFLNELKPFIFLDMPWEFCNPPSFTEPKHLLDLYWQWCSCVPPTATGDGAIHEAKKFDLWTKCCSMLPLNDRSGTTQSPNTLNLFPNHCLPNHSKNKGTDGNHNDIQDAGVRETWVQIHLRSNAPKRIKNACELYRRAGVTFQNTHHKDGFAITFQKGILHIPHLHLDPNQASLLANLAAFEEFKPSKERKLTSYILLLDGLINTGRDVELLERRGVITNKLGSSQLAAAYFNDIGNVCSVVYTDHYCQQQFDELKRYYNSKWNRRLAKLRHEYFNSPWAFISFLAGVILLLLSILQTYYNMYRYYHHR